MIVGLGGYAGHSHKYAKRGGSGYMFRAATVQDLSCRYGRVPAVKASVYDEVGGLDEGFTVAFNDVDFCLRVRRRGLSGTVDALRRAVPLRIKSRGLTQKAPPRNALRASAAA